MTLLSCHFENLNSGATVNELQDVTFFYLQFKVAFPLNFLDDGGFGLCLWNGFWLWGFGRKFLADDIPKLEFIANKLLGPITFDMPVLVP